MGTSSSSGGPSGKSPLLPSWYPSGGDGPQPPDPEPPTDPEEDDGQQDGNSDPKPEPTPDTSKDWRDAKGAFTRYTKNTYGSSIRKAARGYVRTLGGSRGATRSASGGVSAGRRLVSFLRSVSSPGGGIAQTFIQLGLTEYIGRSSEEILAKIADNIAPAGATNDEAIARDAIIETLDHLYTRILENGGDINSLESLTPEMIKDTVIDYVSVYIFNKWIYELGLAVEKNAVTEKQAIEMETEIKHFINAEVKSSLHGKEIREFNLNDRSNQ